MTAFLEPVEYDSSGEIKTIDKAYTFNGWIEILQIFKILAQKDRADFDAEHDILYLPGGEEIPPDTIYGQRLQQLGCFYDDELERWCRYT